MLTYGRRYATLFIKVFVSLAQRHIFYDLLFVNNNCFADGRKTKNRNKKKAEKVSEKN